MNLQALTQAAPVAGTTAYLQEAAARAIALDISSTPSPTGLVGVVGAGAMGRGIAGAFAAAGFDVVVIDASASSLASAEDYIAKRLQRAKSAGRQIGSVSYSPKITDVAGSRVVIECVPEDIGLKQEVLREIESITADNTLIGSNTSTLDINLLSSALTRPKQFIGTHFFIPADITRLLELVPGESTHRDTLRSTLKLATVLGKSPVIAGVCDGFIGNRLFDRFHQEAFYLVEEGASPAQIDQALESWSMAIGPLRALDMVGNDIPWQVRVARRERQPDLPQPRIADWLCENGRYGQKTGAGWYRYEPGQRKPLADPVADELIDACRAELGITPRPISDEEIIARCQLVVMDEAVRLLDDSIAHYGSDIDVVWTLGYGFPAARGGPLFLAEQLGTANVLEMMSAFCGDEVRSPAFRAPSPLWQSLINNAISLTDYRTTPLWAHSSL